MSADHLHVAMDFVGSLAVVGLLAMAYGPVRRHLPGVSLAPKLLGMLFGAVAVLQMHAPVTPFPGMIIDLRIVPITLAGAFLGGRGVLICLIIAITGRAAIGGVGLASGIVAMILAGGAGLAWDRLTTGPGRRDWRAMVGLVMLTSVHFIAVVMLPYDLMAWFLVHALPPLFVTYALAIPMVGTLLERERVQMASEARLRAVRYADPEAGFPARQTLQSQLSQALANGRFDRGAAVLHLTFRPGLTQAAFWGDDIGDLVAFALHQRIMSLLPDGAMLGLIDPGHVVIVAPGYMALGMDGLAASIAQDVAASPIQLPGVAAAQPRLKVRRIDHEGLPDPLALLDIEAETTPLGRAATVPVAGDGSGDNRLFEVAERLIEYQRGASERRLRNDMDRRRS